MKLPITLCVAILAISLNAWAATSLTGILFGDHGGDSGTATGEIRLSVDGHVYHLSYQKPYEQQFSFEDCRYAGSTWTVKADIQADQKGTLISADCSNDSIGPEGAAVQLVENYFDFMKARNYPKAFDLFSATYQGSHSLVSIEAVAKKLDFSSYHLRPPCLDILRWTSQTVMQIRAGVECNIEDGTELASFLFDVERRQTSNEVRIAGIEQVRSPIVTSRVPSEKVRDQSIEKVVRGFLANVGSADYYLYNKVDLNNDGEPEVLVYPKSVGCDSSGCELFILKKNAAQYEVLSKIIFPALNSVLVSAQRTNGWNDLIIESELDYYTVLRFNGHAYPPDPTAEPALTEREQAVAYLSNPVKPEFGIRLGP